MSNKKVVANPEIFSYINNNSDLEKIKFSLSQNANKNSVNDSGLSLATLEGEFDENDVQSVFSLLQREHEIKKSIYEELKALNHSQTDLITYKKKVRKTMFFLTFLYIILAFGFVYFFFDIGALLQQFVFLNRFFMNIIFDINGSGYLI